jgi:putative transposase
LPIGAVIEMKRRNPRFGCRKIAEQISRAFAVEINKDVVRRILIQHYRPVSGGDGPSWLTVMGHARDSLWSVDLFRCKSILLQSYWIMAVVDVFTRRIIGFGVAPADLDGPDICRLFNRAIAKQKPPKYLSSDNDPLFRFHRWLANLRILEVDEIKVVIICARREKYGLHCVPQYVQSGNRYHSRSINPASRTPVPFREQNADRYYAAQ